MNPEELRGPVSDLLEEHGFDEVAKLLREIADGPNGDLAAGHVVRLLPLEWDTTRDGDLFVSTILGSLQVCSEVDDPSKWYWRWCFQEYYDEGREDCESKEAGRFAAERFFFDRFGGAVDSPMAKPAREKAAQ